MHLTLRHGAAEVKWFEWSGRPERRIITLSGRSLSARLVRPGVPNVSSSRLI